MTLPKGLLALAESVADGAAIDWAAEESTSAGDDRAVLRQLRVIAELAALHRTLPADPTSLPHALALRRTAAAPAVGRWAHLDLIERLGGGASGDVYRAFDRHLEREVALKLLHADVIPETDFHSSRIVGEARRLARVHHPNVVTVHGVAMYDGRVGLWMERVKGLTLEQIVRTSGAMSAGEAALVGVDLCRALAALHAADLIHRDIKGQNVMREDGGRIVLMDFGTSRAANPVESQPPHADLAGTPLYLAPEIFNGAPASARTDIYSLGVLLYRLVTTDVPVRASTLEELHEAHRSGRRVRLRDARADLPSAFVRVVEKATAADPAERYATAGELEADLLNSGEAQAVPVDEPPAPSHRVVWWAAAAVAAFTLAAVTSLWPSRQALASKPAADVHAIRSIAVLPLANLSGDPNQEYFADGMTEEMIATLGSLGAVNVISRTSAMQFKGSPRPLPEIARALHVDAILEGTVRMSNGGRTSPSERRVRIDARLIYAGSDTQVWERSFEAVLSDVLALQRQIATAVAEGINVQLTSSQYLTLIERSRPRTPEQVDAFDLYLKGRYEWNRRTADGLKRGVQYFEAAIARDPKFALAYAGLADAYNLLGDHSLLGRGQALTRAAQAAANAVALEPALGEAHASLAYVRLNQFDWKGAEAEFRRALELNPGYATAHQWYAFYLAQQTRFDEAMHQAETALALDPLSVAVNAEMGFVLMHAQRYDGAVAQFEKTLAIDPGYVRASVDLATLYLVKGDRARALTIADGVMATGVRDLDVLADIAYVYARGGRRDQAAMLIRELQNRYEGHEEGAAIGVATALVGMDDFENALVWLQRARDLKDSFVGDLKMDARFDGLRADRRFRDLLASVGLAE